VHLVLLDCQVHLVKLALPAQLEKGEREERLDLLE